MLKGKDLLFLVEVKDHLMSPEVDDWKPCKTQYLRLGSVDSLYTWYVGVLSVNESYCLL